MATLDASPVRVGSGSSGVPMNGSNQMAYHHDGYADPLVTLRQYAHNPQQAQWLQQELSRYPLQPHQTPIHWILWREKCGEGNDPVAAWKWASEYERGLSPQNNVAPVQNAQAFNQPIQGSGWGNSNPQAGPSSAPANAYIPQQFEQQHQVQPQQMTIAPSQLQGTWYQDAQQFSGQIPYQGFNPEHDPRQGGYAHTENAQLAPSALFGITAPQVSPSAQNYNLAPQSSTSTQSHVSFQEAVKQEDSPIPTVSPLASLGTSESSGSSSSTPLNRVPGGYKKPITPSPFNPNVELPLHRKSSWDSSSLDRKPSAASKKAKTDPSSSSRTVAPAQPVPKPEPEAITMVTIRALITPDILRLGRPVGLFKLLRNRIKDDVTIPPLFVPNPTQLLEILQQLKNHAPPIYLSKVAEEEKYLFVLRRWLLKLAKDPVEWEKCMDPLLFVLSKTEMPVDFLVDYKFGRLAKSLVDKSEEKGLASKGDILNAYNQYEKYVKEKLLPNGTKRPKETGEDDSVKKQKTEDSAAVKSEPVAGPSRTAPPTTSSAPRSSSFTPRTKLPDIKKREPGAAAVGANTSGPSTSNSAASGLLAATMSALRARPNSDQDTAATAALTTPMDATESKPIGPKPNKKGHIVRFRDNVPDSGDLLMIREFKEEAHELERAPWQDDPDVHGKSAHQLDMAEGRALRIHESLESEVDWYEPEPFEGAPDMIEPTPEMIEQEARERGILGVIYAAGKVPSDPDDTGVRIIEKTRQTGTWLPAGYIAQQPTVNPVPAAASAQTSASVTQLLGQLNPGLFQQPQAQPSVFGYTPPQPPQQQAQSGYDYYGSNSGQPPPHHGQQQAGYTGGYNSAPGYDQGWRHNGRGYDDYDRHRGGRRGGRGGGGGGGGGWGGGRGGSRRR